jgi:nicotinate phosphoribosyltransferase
MQQLILGRFSKVKVRYELINRGKTQFPDGFAEKVQAQVKMISKLRLKKEELEFLRNSCPFLKETYLEWLAEFTPDSRHVKVTQQKDELRVIIEGFWYQAIYWEVPLMAVISELYFSEMGCKPEGSWKLRAAEKGNFLKSNGCLFADFGLRRRFSSQVHSELVQIMKKYSKQSEDKGGFVGTSNVFLAYKYGLRPIGTMAHELAMVLAVLYGFQSANERLLELWTEEFGGDLGIALTDTFTTNVFLRSFNRKLAMLFDGLRQDSGFPEEFTDKAVNHYQKLGIDPISKTIVFSDGLNAVRAVDINKYCQGKIKCSFGIGTNFTNDVGEEPLNIVIKVTAAQQPSWPWTPVIKLSDSNGKITGDRQMAENAKKLLGI